MTLVLRGRSVRRPFAGAASAMVVAVVGSVSGRHAEVGADRTLDVSFPVVVLTRVFHQRVSAVTASVLEVAGVDDVILGITR